jgi:ABC-type nickel/cobalt efflux system permease component RcnA
MQRGTLMRGVKPFSVASAMGLLVFVSMSPAVFAHPMGNFSINHYSKIIPGAHSIELDYIIDMAEIPTFQQMQESAVVPKSDDPSLVPYLKRESEVLKDGLALHVDGKSLILQTISRQAIFPPGAGGLPTMKMGFVYIATLPSDPRESPALLRYRDDNYPGRAGWKEIIAVNGSGAWLANSSVPTADRSLELTNYPSDMLHSPPQTLEASLLIKAVPSGVQAGNKPEHEEGSGWLVTGGARASGVILKANSQGTPRSAFTELISSKRTDVLFMAMAALIAAVLGGFHALEPGHGKTLVAAYLVGSRGKVHHAVLLGAIVTAAHTISVYALGIITLYASHWILPERLYPWLGIGSGLLVAGLGFTLFIRRYLATEPQAADGHVHDHRYSHRHSPDHAHHHADATVQSHRHNWWGGHVDEVDTHSHGGLLAHEHDHRERRDHFHGGEHEATQAAPTLSLSGLFALGITGGIVPCPAALVVLLGALAFHRVAFGLFLIVAFSAGLAAVLIGLGLAMVYAGRFMSRFGAQGPLTQRWLPLASSAVITVIGITLTVQSLVTVGVFRMGT